MISFRSLLLFTTLSLTFSSTYAASSACCANMQGVGYCDSSAGRLVCKNGFYSACYCSPHAVMDFQLLRGCCLWHGGVAPTFNQAGLIACNDGSVSEECSLGTPVQTIAAW